MNKLIPVLIATALFFPGCSGSESKEKTKDSYEKGKLTLEEIEQKNPVQFLRVVGDNKRNIIGQTVIKGSVSSTAKIVSYKDIDIKLSFFSKTGALLEEDHEVVYETVGPGGKAGFKSKYFAPKGSDSVAFKIIGAGISK